MLLKPLKFTSKNQDKSLFLQTVRDRVECYFIEKKLSKKANVEMYFKTFLFLSAYIFPFFLYLYFNPNFSISIGLWFLMAIGMCGIGMCIMHDANHNAYSDSYKINQWIGYSVNLVGAFAFNWKIQHNVLHHTYTNISNYDDDIDDKTILKLSPHTKSKWVHKFQHFYAFFFYSIATLYWSLAKDFLQLIRYTDEGLNKNSIAENVKLWIRLILSKFVYFFVLIVVPSLYFNIEFSKTIYCFIFMHLIAGLILTTVFQLAHTVDGTDHPIPTSDLVIENDWAVHQMQTTMNFAKSNKFISWFVGGLNYQIEHHLFPNICHVHYPKIDHIVENTAIEFNIPYLKYHNLSGALSAHILALKRFAKTNYLDEN